MTGFTLRAAMKRLLTKRQRTLRELYAVFHIKPEDEDYITSLKLYAIYDWLYPDLAAETCLAVAELCQQERKASYRKTLEAIYILAYSAILYRNERYAPPETSVPQNDDLLSLCGWKPY